jgi:hypothetical protein
MPERSGYDPTPPLCTLFLKIFSIPLYIKPPILSPASEDELADDIMVVPEIEKDIPIPRTKQAAVPDMTTEREVLVRANTIKTVSDLSGDNIEPSKEHQEQAQELARDMMTNKKT